MAFEAPIALLMRRDASGRPYMQIPPSSKYSIDVNLTQPIVSNGKSIDTVRVRIPSQREFARRPKSVPVEIYNLGIIAGLPTAVAANLNGEDFSAICAAHQALVDGVHRAISIVTSEGLPQ